MDLVKLSSFLMQLELPARETPGRLWDSGSSGILIVLLLILCGGLFAVWLLIKRQGFMGKGNAGKLDILETRPLGGRQFLLVGRYGRETFLLGVCPGRIDYLTRLDESAPIGFNEALSDASENLNRDQERD